MKREINCEDCGYGWAKTFGSQLPREHFDGLFDKRPGETLPVFTKTVTGEMGGPDEHLRQQRGKLGKGCKCDGCGSPLVRGEVAVATSVWVDGRNPYHPWEGEFLVGGAR